MSTGRRRRFDDPGQSLAEVGEEALVARLVAAARASPRGRLLVASGDDAAVLAPLPGRDLVLSQDALVEDVDFRRRWITPFQLGGRALTVALSDLAATGARPEACMASLCAPGATRVDDVIALQQGMIAAAALAGCALAGGDVSQTAGPLVIDVSVIGSVRHGQRLSRSAGRPGDVLVVTGVLGRAAAGLALLEGSLRPATPFGPVTLTDAARWRRAQLEPRSRLAEGRAALGLGIGCGADLSDGLWLELTRMAAASACGAELWLDALPMDRGLRRLPAALDCALAGGEDFELLLAMSPRRWRRLQRAWPAGLAQLTEVGRLTAEPGVRCLLGRGGAEQPPPRPRSLHWRVARPAAAAGTRARMRR